MKPITPIWLALLLPVCTYAQNVKDSSKPFPSGSFTDKVLTDSSKRLISIPKFDSSISKEKLKSKIKPPGVKAFSFHGNATVDLFYADFQNPRQLNEQQYARFYINPTIGICGLPFVTNIFLTTENNNFFNSNSISFRFDAQAYRRQLIEKYQKKYQEEQRNLGTRNTDLFKTDKLLQQQKKELEKEMKKMELSDAFAAKAIDKMKEDAMQKTRDSLKNTIDDQKGQLNDSAQVMGSKYNSRIQKYQDSLSNIRKAQKERIEGLKRKMEEMEKHKDSVKEQIEYYKTQMQKYSQLIKDPFATVEDTKTNITDSLSSRRDRIKPSISDIRQFDVGLFYANQTELTTAGLPVKGINFLMTTGNLTYGIGGGKTMSSFNSLTKTRKEFDRNVAIVTLGYQFSKQFTLTWYTSNLWDETKKESSRKSNIYSSISIEHQFRQIKFNTEVAYSKIQSHNEYAENMTIQNNKPPYINYKLSDHIAYKVKVQYELLKNSTFSGSVIKVPLSYLTLGNPYMRRDYLEYEATYKQKLFKNKVQGDIFYKENRNNLNGFETATTKAKGYGINIQTMFKSLPNLSLSYLPYSMGNNHPDSALQTMSQFSVLNAVISYSLFRAKTMWNSLFMFSQSQAELAPGQLSGNILLSSNQTFDYNGKLNINIIGNASRFQYTSDTLNFNQCKALVVIKTSKIFQPQIGGDYVQYKNGASKASLLAGFTFKIKKSFSLRFNYSFSHLYRLWGFDERYAQQAKGAVIFNW